MKNSFIRTLFSFFLFTFLSLSSYSQELKREFQVLSNPFLVGEVYKTYRFEKGAPTEAIPNLRLEKEYTTQVTTHHKDNVKIYTVGDQLYVLSEQDLKKVKRGELALPPSLMTFTLEEEFFISLRNEQNVGTSVTYLKEGLEGNSSLESKSYVIKETTGDKRYELSNHLGNVQTTLTDKPKLQINLAQEKYYVASVISASDYYPFGMAIKNRSKQSLLYRYGFNGQEKDDEIEGGGNSYSAEYWQYSPRIARRWNIDPMAKSMPDLSPYIVFNNNPLFYYDPNGAFAIDPQASAEQQKVLRKAEKLVAKKLRSLTEEQSKEIEEITGMTGKEFAKYILSDKPTLEFAHLNDPKSKNATLRQDQSKIDDGIVRYGATVSNRGEVYVESGFFRLFEDIEASKKSGVLKGLVSVGGIKPENMKEFLDKETDAFWDALVEVIIHESGHAAAGANGRENEHGLRGTEGEHGFEVEEAILNNPNEEDTKTATSESFGLSVFSFRVINKGKNLGVDKKTGRSARQEERRKIYKSIYGKQ